MSDPTRTLAGVILLTIVTIEFGGWFLTKIARGQVPMTDFQKAFARAGHAHAGVLVILSLVGLLYVDLTGLTGFWLWVGRLALPIAAILMSGGSSPRPPARTSLSRTSSSPSSGAARPASPSAR